jgi:hypothetical protein
MKTIKKAQNGAKSKSSLGMKSVKSGYDNNSGVTRADFVAIGKGTAKSGAKMKMGGKMAKQAAVAIAMKKAGKTPKKMQYGGKAASMAPMKKGGSVKKAPFGALLPLAAKAAPMVAGMFGGGGKGKSGGMGGMLGGLLGGKNGKTVKKAEDGAGLRKGQYRRLGRIAENNPERAERVAERMNMRASRVKRGEKIANPRKIEFNPRKMREMLRSETTKSTMKSGGSMKKCKYGCK